MRGKKRSPEERVSVVAGPLPPCRVCGEQAAGFHYGANTCEACKGFFRRSLLRNGDYECIRSGNCTIGPNRRKSCPKCRYLKCLSVGMSKEAIKTGRYTYTKRTQDTLEIKMLTEKTQPAKSYLIMDNDCACVESAVCSFEQRSLHENTSDGNSLYGNSYCSLSPAVGSSVETGSAAEPVSPASTASSSLTELTSTFSINLSSLSSSSSRTCMQELQTEHLKNTTDFPRGKEPCFSPASLECDFRLGRVQCAELLAADNRDVSPASHARGVSPESQTRGVSLQSQTIGVSPASQTRGVPPASQTRGMSLQSQTIGVSPASQTRGVPPASQTRGVPPASQTRGVSPKSQISIVSPESQASHVYPESQASYVSLELQTMDHLHSSGYVRTPVEAADEAVVSNWQVYSEAELDEFIAVIVSGHRTHVEDVNSLPDENIQKMFRECRNTKYRVELCRHGWEAQAKLLMTSSLCEEQEARGRCQEISWEVKVAGVMLTTSPMKFLLVFKISGPNKERCNLQTEIFGHLGTIQRDEHDRIYASTGLDVDGRLDNLSYAAQKMDVYVRQMIAFMKLIPGFRSLQLSDQTALVKASMDDLFILGYYRGYNKEERMVVEATKSYCKHQMLFSAEDGMDIIFDIAQRLQGLQLTFEMIVVLKALCIFFTDRATLEDTGTIEQLQFKVVQALLLLLKRHAPHQENLWFARIMSILSLTREHTQCCHKFILAHMLSGSYIERFYNVPIIIEFLHAHLNH